MLKNNPSTPQGEPIRVATEDFKKIVSVHQGNSEGQRWLLTKYVGGKWGFDFHYARPVESVKFFDKLVKGKKHWGITGKNRVRQARHLVTFSKRG